jgi:uncharacterized membrane protein
MSKGSHPENEQLIAVLCYFVVGVIWYFVDKKMAKSELVKFHSKQVINLWIINLAVSAVASVMVGILPYIAFTKPLAELLLLVLWVFGLVYAVNQKKKEIPIIGELAEKYLHY